MQTTDPEAKGEFNPDKREHPALVELHPQRRCLTVHSVTEWLRMKTEGKNTVPINYSAIAPVISVWDLSLSPRMLRAEHYPAQAAWAARGW